LLHIRIHFPPAAGSSSSSLGFGGAGSSLAKR
jgi:hypothetical protein